MAAQWSSSTEVQVPDRRQFAIFLAALLHQCMFLQNVEVLQCFGC